MDRIPGIAFRIWLRAVILTNLILTTLFIYRQHSLDGLCVLVIGIPLAVLTVFLIAVIAPIVKVSVRLPCTPTAQLAWLTAALCLVAFLFIMLIFDGFNEHAGLMEDPEFRALLIVSCVSILLAVIWTRRSLMRLRNTL